MRVIVVGGGVIGLGLGFELVQAGAEVTLLEQRTVGSGASQGNAGWLTPALSALPVAAPGVVGQALRWMARPDSPFYLPPRRLPQLAPWLWAFRRASSRDAFGRGLAALVAHNRDAMGALLRWRDAGVEFELHRTGLVFAALTERPIEAELHLYAALWNAGFPVEVQALSGAELRKLEPAISDACVAGLYSPSEWHVRPESLTVGLAAAFRRAGGELREDTHVENLRRAGGGWTVSTASGDVRADAVVVATGASVSLLRRLGMRLPIEAAKGYSITSPGEGVRPRHSVYLLEARVACSPYDDGVRLAGTLEFDGEDVSLNGRRIGALTRAAERYLRWRPAEQAAEWAGLRPLAPDSLPVVGPVPGLDRLFVSTGHGMAGVTQAAVAAELLAPVVLGAAMPPELAPFAPSRFYGVNPYGYRVSGSWPVAVMRTRSSRRTPPSPGR